MVTKNELFLLRKPNKSDKTQNAKIHLVINKKIWNMARDICINNMIVSDLYIERLIYEDYKKNGSKRRDALRKEIEFN